MTPTLCPICLDDIGGEIAEAGSTRAEGPQLDHILGHKFFVGGRPGLNVGDTLDGNDAIAPVNGEPETMEGRKAFICTDREQARFLAGLFGDGDLYRVEPMAGYAMTPSTFDSGFVAFEADQVRVAGIVTRSVRFRMATAGKHAGKDPIAVAEDTLERHRIRVATIRRDKLAAAWGYTDG